jgi:hypothetical protein
VSGDQLAKKTAESTQVGLQRLHVPVGEVSVSHFGASGPAGFTDRWEWIVRHVRECLTECLTGAAQVADADKTVRSQEDIGGIQITARDRRPGVSEGLQSPAQLFHDVDSFLNGKEIPVVQDFAQSLAADIFLEGVFDRRKRRFSQTGYACAVYGLPGFSGLSSFSGYRGDWNIDHLHHFRNPFDVMVPEPAVDACAPGREFFFDIDPAGGLVLYECGAAVRVQNGDFPAGKEYGLF